MKSNRACGVAAFVLVLASPLVALDAAAGVPTPPVSNRQVQASIEDAPRTIPLGAGLLYYVAAPQANVAAGGAAFRVGSLAFSGNTLVTAEALQGQAAALVGTNATYADLVTAAQQLTRFYQSRGFPFATVVAPPQRGEGGVARFQVNEGRLGKVRVEGNSNYTEEAIRYAVAGLEPGKPVTRDALETAVLNLNALPGVSAVAQPAAGASGDTDVLIKLSDRRFGFRFTIDNHGREDIGLRRVAFEGRFASLSGWGDELRFGVVGAEGGGLSHQTLGYSVPVDAAGSRLSLSYALTSFDVGVAAFAPFDFEGENSVIRVDYTMPLTRGLADTSSVVFMVERIQAEMTTNGAPLSVNALTLATIGYSARGTAADSTRWSRDISFSSNFQDNHDGIATDAVLGRFQADLMVNSPIDGDTLRFEGRFGAGYSLDPAIDWAKFTTGGNHSVRAYQTAEIMGDGGFFASAELQRWVGGGAGRAAFVAFADAAYVGSHDAPGVTQTDGPWIAGVGVGVRFGGRNFYGAFEYGVPVGSRDSTDGNRDRVWLSITGAL